AIRDNTLDFGAISHTQTIQSARASTDLILAVKSSKHHLSIRNGPRESIVEIASQLIAEGFCLSLADSDCEPQKKTPTPSQARSPRFDLASEGAYDFWADAILIVRVAARNISDTCMLQNRDLKIALCPRPGIF
ncbi:MAG: hypothetical protein EBY32_20795, partial [Proteobacteria bacterium]|nr:hypothetical protein [Pseudomonadota bacterium]